MFDSAPFVFRLTITATLIALGQPASAATVNLDGKEHKRLSDAVQAAITADDGPHVVNITTDELPLADTGFTISEPITINGDADGNGKKCDILVDIAGIRRQPTSETRSQKCYIEIISEGAVEINDLQIHPDADASAMSDDQLVDAIRVYCPPKKVDVSHYTLNRVWIPGATLTTHSSH